MFMVLRLLGVSLLILLLITPIGCGNSTLSINKAPAVQDQQQQPQQAKQSQPEQAKESGSPPPVG